MTMQEILRACLDALVGVVCLLACGVFVVFGLRLAAAWLRTALAGVCRRYGVCGLSMLLVLLGAWTVAGQKQRPANATENARWRARGAHVDGFTIPALGWSFRTPAGFLDSLLVYSYGEIQPDVETAYFPRPFPEVDLSVLPEGRWGMLPHEGAESLFWHATSPSNSLILTWQNAVYNRDANCPTNLQIELFSNGTYVYRYDDRTEHHAVEYPFDLDGDGLENSVDPDPLTPGNDAHGTNAEWYDLVCSDVFSKTEQPNSLPIPLPDGESVFYKPGVNTNAYYFVNVVAQKGPAPIYFNSSHPGRLGSPVIVALAGETNSVPLLVGATYSVTSDVPFTVACPTNSFAEVAWDDGVNATVRWPLNFTFTEEISGTGRSYTVGVEPFDPGGTFSWGHDHGGATLQSVSPGDFGCGCVTIVGNVIQFGCSSSCACGGRCVAHGAFMFENALFEVVGGECRCGLDDPGYDYSFEPASTTGPFVDVSFSRPVVIFEDSFENSPGVYRSRRSTRVRLKVAAYGGSRGGILSCSESNLEKLRLVSEGTFDFLDGKVLAPYEYYVKNYICEGVAPSMLTSDIVVGAILTESETGVSVSDDAALSAIRVELTPQRQAPANKCTHRHSFGVFELVDCVTVPSVPGISWQLHGGGTNPLATDGFINVSTAPCVLRCPLTNNCARLEVCCQGARYCPIIDYVEPTNIVPEQVDYRMIGAPRLAGSTGGVALKLWLYVYPKDVSFAELAFEEVPWLQGGRAWGYYTLPSQLKNRYHGMDQGAGQWHNISDKNEFGIDFVGAKVIEEWIEGELVWDVPIGWRGRGTSESTGEVKIIAPPTRFQTKFSIQADGTFRVEKFGHWISREAVPQGVGIGRFVLDGQERDLKADFERWKKEIETEEEVFICIQ